METILWNYDKERCSDDSCSSMPCLNGASCILSDEHMYLCNCAPNFSGRHCEFQLDPCASDPCAYGGTCISLQGNKFSCLCPAGSSGDYCEIETSNTDESGVVLDFYGDSYLEFPTLKRSAHTLSVELWFLTRTNNGLLLYNGQKPKGIGDFVALTIINGFLHFTYNLGSGKADISSLEPVSLGVWHSVRISRLREKGMLQVDHGPAIEGESKGASYELNLGQPFYVGGVPDFIPLKYTLVVQEGLNGAIQRIIVNDEVWDDVVGLATDQRNIEYYSGPPCLPNVCQNGGYCIPNLNDFRCQCSKGYGGKLCNESEESTEMSDVYLNPPVRFEGSTFMQFSEGIKGMKFTKTKENLIEIVFRTSHKKGLILYMNKGTNVRGDYLAIAINNGHVQLSFNLGKEIKPLILESPVLVDDNYWHTIIVKRNKRLAHLTVDETPTVTKTSEPGATELNTDGILWIGGSSNVPSGLPDAYYHGFHGCISSVTVDSESLNLSAGFFKYCQPS